MTPTKPHGDISQKGGKSPENKDPGELLEGPPALDVSGEPNRVSFRQERKVSRKCQGVNHKCHKGFFHPGSLGKGFFGLGEQVTKGPGKPWEVLRTFCLLGAGPNALVKKTTKVREAKLQGYEPN